MKRTIKFRAWDKCNKEMISWYELINNDKSLFLQAIESDSAEVMQFTGLTDKNGKEIYEFDIKRKEISINDEMGFEETLYYVCLYIPCWCRFAWISLNDYNLFGEDCVDEENLDNSMQETYGIFENEKEKTTICGNLFENPELQKLF